MDLVSSPATATPRASSPLAAIAGVIATSVIIAWEVARPTLPVSFELAAAARSPGAATWLGRLPMAAFGVAGMVALYIFFSRTAERRAAGYAISILATMPAWFVHGRTMTGAIVPMACFAGVLAGLGVAVLDLRASTRARGLALTAAVVATAVTGLAARWGIAGRGLAAVVAVPALAVGLAGLLFPGGARARSSWVTLALGGAIVGAGALCALCFPDGAGATLLLGGRATAPTAPTFDAPVTALAYGLVPWTPFVPFALARRPSSAGHLAVMVGAALAIAAHALLAPRTGSVSVVGVAAIAAAIAAMLRTLEDVRRPAATLIASTIVIGLLVAHDVGVTPDRVLVAFGASDTAMPDAHAAASSLAIRSSMWLCVALSCAALVTPRAWLPAGRGFAIVAGGVFAGLVPRIHTYPELLARLSPGAAFDAWVQCRHPGEPLGLVGIDKRSVAFAPGTAVVPHNDARSAGAWLAAAGSDGPDSPRRFLALGATELPRVNAAFRAVRGTNVPVLAGQESATLLAASAFSPGEHTENPLDAIVLATAPRLQHPLDAVLEDRLEAVGWEVTDDRGRVVDAVPRGSRHAHVRLFLRARTDGLSGYCTFLHIEHTPSRFSAEHREHAYPMSIWRTGDVVVDDFEVKLPAQFRPGSYRVYWGVGVLPCENDQRMHVTTGATDGRDRIPGGTLEVQ